MKIVTHEYIMQQLKKIIYQIDIIAKECLFLNKNSNKKKYCTST